MALLTNCIIVVNLSVLLICCICFINGAIASNQINDGSLIVNQKTQIIRKHDFSVLNALVVGDWGRDGEYNQTMVAEQMALVGEALDVDFIISVGDNFYEDGLSDVWDSAFDTSFVNIYNASSLKKPWHVVLGNHDYRGDALAQLSPILKARDSRWHCERSFMIRHFFGGGSQYIDFVFYDTNPFVEKYWNDTEHTYDWRGVEPKEEFIAGQLEFLSSTLSTSNATWKVVVGHHPIRTVGYHGNTEELQGTVLPILKNNKVDLYINGHDHCIEHIIQDDIQFITSGGGSKSWRGIDKSADMSGLQLYYDGQGFLSLSVSEITLSFWFHDALGNILHEKHIDRNVA